MKGTSSTETVTVAPTVQKIQRLKTIEKEHKDALERAVSLNVPHAVEAAEDETTEKQEGEGVGVGEEGEGEEPSNDNKNNEAISTKSNSRSGKLNWDEVVQHLFKKGESGDLRLKRDVSVPK